MEMNKDGKGRILLILIPVFIVLSLIISDTIISYMTNKKFKSDTEKIIVDVMNRKELGYEEYYDAMKREFERKGYDTDKLLVEANNYEIYVENEHNFFGLFTSFKTFNVITDDEKILGFIPVIKSIKKIDGKEGEIKILGVTFKVKRNSKAFLRVTAKTNYDGELEFIYEK